MQLYYGSLAQIELVMKRWWSTLGASENHDAPTFKKSAPRSSQNHIAPLRLHGSVTFLTVWNHILCEKIRKSIFTDVHLVAYSDSMKSKWSFIEYCSVYYVWLICKHKHPLTYLIAAVSKWERSKSILGQNQVPHYIFYSCLEPLTNLALAS